MYAPSAHESLSALHYMEQIRDEPEMKVKHALSCCCVPSHLKAIKLYRRIKVMNVVYDEWSSCMSECGIYLESLGQTL